MKLYAGIDLHANNNYLAVIDESDTRVYKRKLPNKPDVILAELEPLNAICDYDSRAVISISVQV